MKTALKILSTAIAAFYMASCSTEPIYYDPNFAPVLDLDLENSEPVEADQLVASEPQSAPAPAPKVVEPAPAAVATATAVSAPKKSWWKPAKKQEVATKSHSCAFCTSKAPSSKKTCTSTCTKWWEPAPKVEKKKVVKAPTTCKNCGSKYCSKPNKCKSPYKNKYYNTTMQGSSGQRHIGLVPTMKSLATD